MGKIVFEHELSSPSSRVWTAIADTDRFNKAAGLPAVVYRDEPQEDGTTRRFGSTHKFGMDLDYEELPFHWVHERFFAVTRIYSKGPVKNLRQTTTLRPLGQGCVVETTWEWEPRGPLDALVASASIKQLGLKPFKKLYGELDARLAKQEQQVTNIPVFGDPKIATDDQRAKIDALLPRVRVFWDSPLIAQLGKALAEKTEDELRRMQPVAFSRAWKADRQEVLNTFLAATRAGLLRMRWDVICPHCRGDKQNLSTLAEVKEKAFCSSCNIDFDVDLDRALEAVFTPHPQVREIEEAKYCLGGPGVTPHIVYQRYLRPGEKDVQAFVLPPGRYRLRTTGEKSYRWIDLVEERGREKNASFCIADQNIEGADVQLSNSDNEIAIENVSSRNMLVTLEGIAWARDALSAGELVADQRFRDLFSGEVLAPGVKLAVEHATIIFTDLVGSTAMYQSLGDACAFSLVWTHFDVLRTIVAEHRGAIVKTIGDAIMAVFMRPSDALEAADALHHKVSAFCRERGHEYPVALKVGIHDGPCIAVTLNERLDYFGSTVNLAARVESKSEGDDILVSLGMAERTEDAAFLRDRGWTSEPLAAQCKGFAEPIPMLRFRRGAR
jgi:class 3 adenylate cyclase